MFVEIVVSPLLNCPFDLRADLLLGSGVEVGNALGAYGFEIITIKIERGLVGIEVGREPDRDDGDRRPAGSTSGERGDEPASVSRE